MLSEVLFIVVAMLFASVILSIIFFIAWKTLVRKPYTLNWSLAFAAAALQCFFYPSSQWFPSYESWWLTVNAFATILMTLGLRGHCQRTRFEHLPDNLWPYAGGVYGLIVWTTIVTPHAGLRMALLPAAASATLFLSALMIMRHRSEPRPVEWAVATSMAIVGLILGIIAGMAVLQGAAGDAAYPTHYVQLNVMAVPAAFIATGMFVTLMLASDLSSDLKELAVRDQLTGLYERRGLGEHGAAAYETARRHSMPLSVVMMDIDRFKSINDEHGHAVGDAALCHFADVLKEERRADDIFARVGGEEFALVLPGTDLKAALKVADGLRERIEAAPMRIGEIELTMTASFGVATVNSSDNCLSDTITRADRALYRSKRGGRNQVDLESSQLMRAADGKLFAVRG